MARAIPAMHYVLCIKNGHKTANSAPGRKSRNFKRRKVSFPGFYSPNIMLMYSIVFGFSPLSKPLVFQGHEVKNVKTQLTKNLQH